MQPFPAHLRRVYLLAFIAAFFMLLPVAIFYADGWRFKQGYGLVRTGGVYVEVPYDDATLFLAGKQVGHTGLLQRGFYLGNLAPSAYVVQVEKEGYRSWGRILIVEPQLVTDTKALLIPDEIPLKQIVVTNSSTTTRLVSRTEYNDLLDVFATSTAASSTVPVDVNGSLQLYIRKGEVVVTWEDNDIPPSIFCMSPSACLSEISAKSAGGEAQYAAFYRGGIVYRTKEGSVYFTEFDVRPSTATALLFSSKDVEVRVINDDLILKSGNALYEVQGL